MEGVEGCISTLTSAPDPDLQKPTRSHPLRRFDEV